MAGAKSSDLGDWALAHMMHRRRTLIATQGPRHALAVLAVSILRPTLSAAALTMSFAVPLGIVAGSASAFLVLVRDLVVAFFSSFWAHETGHLIALDRRALERCSGRVYVEASWLVVSLVAPRDAIRARTAAAGPLCGVGACLLLMAAGLRPAVAVTVCVMHLVNLTPLCPDGRIVVGRIFGA